MKKPSTSTETEKAEQDRQAALAASLTPAQREQIAERIAARRERDRGTWR